MMRYWVELREALDNIPLVDTHEHFLPPDYLTEGGRVLFMVLRNSYVAADCISAGMERDWWRPCSVVYGVPSLEKPEEFPQQRWDELQPYLDRVRHTSYYRCLLGGLRALYGFEGELRPNNWEEVSSRIRRAHEQSDWFDAVLRRAGIRLALWDPYFAVDLPDLWSRFLVPVFRVDDFLGHPRVHPESVQPATEIARKWGIEVESLEDLLKAIDEGFTRYMETGGVATKMGIAYYRSLLFGEVSRAPAEAAFTELMSDSSDEARLTLGNFVVRHLIRRSIECGFPIQIHTGMNYGQLEHARPTKLVVLFQEFPQARFVLFHGSYPYADEAGLLAKTFPNVYLDLCWLPLLSMKVAAEVLERWVELVPQSKIMWGGDACTVEECYGAVLAFKEVLARALGKKVEEGYLEKGEALDLASRIMHLNATELFGLRQELNSEGGNA